MSNKVSVGFLLPKELQELKQQQQQELILKSLLAIAMLAAGIATTVLFGSGLLAVGISLIIISSLAIYHYYCDYLYMRNIYLRTAAAICENFI